MYKQKATHPVKTSNYTKDDPADGVVSLAMQRRVLRMIMRSKYFTPY